MAKTTFKETNTKEIRTFEYDHSVDGRYYTVELTAVFVNRELSSYSIRTKLGSEAWDDEYPMNLNLSLKTKLERMAMEYLEVVEGEYK